MFRRLCTTVILGFVLVVGIAVAPPSVADAAPRSGDQWTDCAGPTLCTRYWSRPKTRDLDSELHSWQFWVIQKAFAKGKCGSGGGAGGALYSAICGAAVNAKYQSELNGLPDAARAAKNHNGCLQVAWRKDGKGKQVWGYTTSRDYCWG